MWIHQHFRCAELFASQEVVRWSMARCRYLQRSPGSNAVHTECMAKLPFVFSLQRRASQIEITPFGEGATLYGPAGICMWMFWVWMCTILLHKCHQFGFFFFFVMLLLWTQICSQWIWPQPCRNTLDALSFLFIKQGYSDYINQIFGSYNKYVETSILLLFFLFNI